MAKAPVIGPGPKAGFLLERVVAAPEAAIVGLEIRRKWATVGDEKLALQMKSLDAQIAGLEAQLAQSLLRREAGDAGEESLEARRREGREHADLGGGGVDPGMWRPRRDQHGAGASETAHQRQHGRDTRPACQPAGGGRGGRGARAVGEPARAGAPRQFERGGGEADRAMRAEIGAVALEEIILLRLGDVVGIVKVESRALGDAQHLVTAQRFDRLEHLGAQRAQLGEGITPDVVIAAEAVEITWGAQVESVDEAGAALTDGSRLDAACVIDGRGALPSRHRLTALPDKGASM